MLVPSSNDRRMGSFYLLAVVNNAAGNLAIQISAGVRAFSSFRCIPRSGNARSHRDSVLPSLSSCHAVLHSGCLTLHSHQHYTRAPVSPHPCQHLVLSFFIIPTLIWLKCHFVVLVYVFLTTGDAELLFMCLLAIWRFFFWTPAHSSPLLRFKIGLFVILLLSCSSSLCILDISPLSDK